MTTVHSFHIPVMGTAFSIDSPLKVSQYGIDSVISLVDDIMMEKLRKFYCSKHELPYSEISTKTVSYRSERITSYLNMVKQIAEEKFEELTNYAHTNAHEIKEYFSMLPDNSSIKKEFNRLCEKYLNLDEMKDWIKENLHMGKIDVNIMTKVDKTNYHNKEKLPPEFNDAHAALKGFAMSDLESSIILSAGLNPRLYSYIGAFDDFYPDENGKIKKKITLKVSDYRSATIQGKFLAKKGLWVSEFRIESGINCGGHSFASDGNLLGPILAEFKEKRETLTETIYEVFSEALAKKNRSCPIEPPAILITAQGGVGTNEEHRFLLEHFEVDSVGWGTPFLLVPEVTTVDENSLGMLIDAKEDDLYLSNISPLGVPFNSLRGNTMDIEKQRLINQNNPGSKCPKKYIKLNFEYTDKGICTASRQYQYKKIKLLKQENLPQKEYQSRYNKIVEKACLCVGLSTAATLVNDLDNPIVDRAVSICPGPNLAYFSRKMSLSEMVNHIYGRTNVIERTDRPNMFVKELSLYVDFIRDKLSEAEDTVAPEQTKSWSVAIQNLKEGIQFYYDLFDDVKDWFAEKRDEIFAALKFNNQRLDELLMEIEMLSNEAVLVEG